MPQHGHSNRRRHSVLGSTRRSSRHWLFASGKLFLISQYFNPQKHECQLQDVKPGNYTIGRIELNEQRKVYILDFGMARKFTSQDGVIRKPRQAAGFRGTVRYAPISCHLQRELCRKDDVETW